MITRPNDFLMQAWRQQVDGCLRTTWAAYWRRFYEVGAQMQASLAQCMVPAPAAAAPAAVDESKRTMLTLIDQAYKQWLDTAQHLYKLPAVPAQSKPETRP